MANGGGLYQLILRGGEDVYLNGNPEMSYWKAVYKRHSNFSMESISIPFDKLPTFSTYSNSILNCKLQRIGDLVSDCYLVLDLPNIYGDQRSAFQWTPFLGYTTINWVKLTIGDKQIDKQYGEWMNIWNELTLTAGKRDVYDRMVGNSPDFRIYSRNVFTTNDADYSDDNVLYTKKRLYIPLTFWFCRNSSLALPLVCLQNQDVHIQVELTPLTQWFLLGSQGHSPQEFFAEDVSNMAVDDLAFRTKMQNAGYDGYSVWNYFLNKGLYENITTKPYINAYIEVKYTFLDIDEQKYLVKVPQEYLITQVQQQIFDGLSEGQNTVQIYLNNPVKECFFMFSHLGVNGTNNNRFNYTMQKKPLIYQYFNQANENNIFSVDLTATKSKNPSMPATEYFNLSSQFFSGNFVINLNNIIDNTSNQIINNKNNIDDDFLNIFQQGRFLFNGQERFKYNDRLYFEYVEPYKFHQNSSRLPGIYTYNFGLNPDSDKPSGSCNFSKINKFQFEFYLKTPLTITDVDENYGMLAIYNTYTDESDTIESETQFTTFGAPYELRFYAMNYNILKIENGYADTLFHI